MLAVFSTVFSLYVFLTSLLLFTFTVFSSAFYAHSHPVSHLTPYRHHPPRLSLAPTPLSASAVLSCTVCLVLQGQDRAVLTGTSPEQCETEGGRHRNWVKEGERVRFVLTRADWINSWKQLDLFLPSVAEGRDSATRWMAAQTELHAGKIQGQKNYVDNLQILLITFFSAFWFSYVSRLALPVALTHDP